LSDLYETPPEVFGYWDRLFDFDMDACAEITTAKCVRFYVAQDDALSRPWHKEGGSRVWMNPPYSNPKPWVEKAIAESQQGTFVLGLLPADTSTKWFELLRTTKNVSVVELRGRIRFLLNGVRMKNSPKFGNVAALFWPVAGTRKAGAK
jgi:phage N-6-adenine-methyltransferase